MVNVQTPTPNIRNVNIKPLQHSCLCLPDDVWTSCVFVANRYLCLGHSINLNMRYSSIKKSYNHKPKDKTLDKKILMGFASTVSKWLTIMMKSRAAWINQ